jgi:hypothetical protein
MRVMKKHQVLPAWMAEEILLSGRSDRDRLIYQLVEMGWTLTAIGESIAMTREGVRQIHKKIAASLGHALLSHAHLPVPPSWPDKPKRTLLSPKAATLTRLLELMPKAQQVRGKSPRFRKEAEEFTALLNHAHKVEGVSMSRLAKLLGVTHGAIRFRLCRYGYLKPVSGRSKVYNAISLENRFSQEQATNTDSGSETLEFSKVRLSQ